jgi:aryl-alcohol dehydrogenase-like predicted oxidoreductase
MMKQTFINGLGRKASVVAFGAGNVDFSNTTESHEMLDMYFSLGGNLIDTANIYGKWLESGTNESEIIIGEWLDRKINVEKAMLRSDVIISTKCGHFDLDATDVSRLNEKCVRDDLEESLAALKTDYVDIYWLHRDSTELPVESILEPLIKLKKEGKIKLFGLSNWTTKRIIEAQNYFVKENSDGFFGVQNRWGYASMNPEGTEDFTLVAMTQEEYEWHLGSGFAAMPYSAMAKGYFTKLSNGPKSEMNPKLLNYYDNQLNDLRLNAAREVSQKQGRPISQISLAFLLNQPFPVFPIVRFANKEQLTDAVEASSIILTDDEIRILSQGVLF